MTPPEVDPPVVVVDDADGTRVTFTFEVEGGATTAGITLRGPDGSRVDVAAAKTGEEGGEQKWAGARTFTRADAAGRWKVTSKATSVVGTAIGERWFQVRQVRDTDIRGFNASPEPVRRGGTLTLDGRLVIDGSGGWHAYPRQKVHIAFRARGAAGYERVARAYTDGRGHFTARVTAKAAGWWRAEYDGSSRAHKAVSDSDQVDVRRGRADSRIIRFNASPEPVKYGRYVTARGVLQVREHGSWASNGYEKVALYFKRSGRSTWEYVKTTTTGRSGAFLAKVKAWHSGHWQVRFAGDRAAGPAASYADHVKVRR
ncbi:hypothetical protein [Sphaerisporangium rufum]|uniref:hypothetical protein n=1 Tax=Sphaerisporangium rufum TaxID=1381558 RepID=UPI00195267F8|nr:hypothetical protein [Sphaerisporangium rufum]